MWNYLQTQIWSLRQSDQRLIKRHLPHLKLKMLTLFTLIIFTLPAIAAHRDLNKGEADALYAVWGVRNMQALSEIEENPKKFWKDTEHKLFKSDKKLISHLDFCKWFIPKIKEQLAQRFKKIEPQPWFADNAIEDIVKRFIEEGSPNFYYAIATCYTYALDYTLIYLTKEIERNSDSYAAAQSRLFMRQKHFERYVEKGQEDDFQYIIPTCHEKLRWQVTPGGLFSFFDSLVTQSKGFQLCSVSPNPKDWIRFSVHNGQFSCCSGVLDHDAFAHAKNTLCLASDLNEHSISAQDQFDACCNPDALTGDLITMTHQVQAWFTQFHEAPSQIGSLNDPSNLASLLFPGKTFLSDPGLRDITPYFMHLPSDHNWRTTPLQKVDIDSYAIQGALLAWRSLYCFQSFSFLTNKDISSYMDILGMDLRYLTKPDLMRSPQFIHTILGGFCASEGHSLVTKTTENFDAFVERNKASAQKVIQSIKTLTQEHAGPLVVCLPFPVHFLTLAFYASELRALRREHTVELRTTKSHFGLFDKGSKEPLRSITIL